MAPRRHRARGDLRRRELIEIASDLFAVRGYRGTGLAAVAEAAGITPAGVLHYFGSKTGLLQAVLETHYLGQLPRLQEAYEDHTEHGLRATFDLVAEGVVQRPALARLFSVLVAENLAPEDPAHENFVDRYAGLRRVLVAWFEQAKKDGVARRSIDSHGLAVEVVAFMDGLQLQWLLDPQAVDVRASYQAYVDGLLDRIAPG